MAVNTTLVQFTEDITSVVTAICGMFTDVLTIFTQPPLSFFLGLVVCGAVIRMAAKVIRGRH